MLQRDNGRLPELDGLRGIAALVVVCCHVSGFALGYAAVPAWLRLSPLGVLIGGPQAVIVFFVLSGFVLALPYARGAAPRYGPFVMRRYLRLAPAAVAALGLSALVLGLGPAAAASIVVFGSGLLLTGGKLLFSLNPPAWSLVQEARASTIFPLIVRVARSRLAIAAIVVLWVALRIVVADQEYVSAYMALPAFVVGARLALGSRWGLDRLSTRSLAAVGLLAVYGAGVVFRPLPLQETLAYPLELLAAVALVVMGLRTVPALRHRVARYLGRISYSLYLVHYPLLMAIAPLGRGLAPLAGLLAIGIADVSQRVVETPAIRLGRRVGAVRPPRSPAPLPAAPRAAGA